MDNSPGVERRTTDPDSSPGRRRHHAGRRGRGRASEGGDRGRRRRAPRGDVKAAVLLLLAEEPMHGYQLMQAIADRSDGRWTPSPGAVYPCLNQLEDEGLVHVTADSGRRLATLTADGLRHAEAFQKDGPDPFAPFVGGTGVDLRGALEQLADATRQVGRSGTETQREAAAKVLVDARRSMYLLLADTDDEA